MMMQMLVHHMIFILLLSICGASTAAPLIAKPGCLEKCGNVIIPYPFGIGPNESCYYDEWFQIDCNEGEPFLRLTELEVRNISTDGRLQVYSPVTFFCEGDNNSQAADLSDSPFVYSQSFNIFAAVSCDSLVSASSAGFVFGGCRSECDEDYTYLYCDIGINCCQTSIPRYLTAINVTLLGGITDCNKFAFVVDRDWFEETTFSSFSAITARMNSTRKVPVSLDWRINNDTRAIELFKRFIVDAIQYQHDVNGFPGNLSRDSHFSTIWDPSCYIDTPRGVNWSAIYCSCRSGFGGNPYLGEDSCDDINECQDAHPPCFGNRKCVNEYGSYRCEDDRRKAKLILAAGLSSSLGLLLLLIGLWFGYKFLKKKNEIKRKKMFFKRNGGLLLEQQLSSGEVNVEKIKLFKSQELEKSTDNFNVDRILGQGG